MFKKVLIHTRRSMKLIILISVTLLFILAIVALFYKISYSVSLDGQMLGYTDNKSKLQTQINEYIENGESENTAFVQIDSLPQYKICLLKRDVKANDDSIFNTIKSGGTTIIGIMLYWRIKRKKCMCQILQKRKILLIN